MNQERKYSGHDTVFLDDIRKGKHEKNEFQIRSSLFDEFVEESLIRKSKFRGIYRFVMVFFIVYILIYILVIYIYIYIYIV